MGEVFPIYRAEMMGTDLVNCTCNYFLNYNCRVISTDRVHNIDFFSPSHIRSRAIEGLHICSKVLLEISISAKYRLCDLIYFTTSSPPSKRNDEFGEEKIN